MTKYEMMSIMSFACSRAHGNVMCPDSEYKPCGLVRHGHVAPFVLDSFAHAVMSGRMDVHTDDRAQETSAKEIAHERETHAKEISHGRERPGRF